MRRQVARAGRRNARRSYPIRSRMARGERIRRRASPARSPTAARRAAGRLGDRGELVAARLDVGADRPGSLEEELDGWGDLIACDGDGEGLKLVHALAANVEDTSAGDEQVQIVGVDQQIGHIVRCIDQLFHVVEHEQHPRVAQPILQPDPMLTPVRSSIPSARAIVGNSSDGSMMAASST